MRQLGDTSGLSCTVYADENDSQLLTFFLLLLISLLWEVTLALPYGWWEYRPRVLTGLHIGAWFGLPIEAACVWMAVSFTAVITYEVIKIWKALGTRVLEAFFGIGK